MAPIKTTRWDLPPHTRAKHEILRRYLEAWLPILSSWSGRVVFIDGFAGPGRYSSGEPGSPVIALQALLDHPYFKQPQPGREVVFLFIEQDAARLSALQGELAVISTPSWIKVLVREGTFVDHMTEILDTVEGGGHHLAPTFAFVDPFGFSGVPMNLVARITRHPKSECLISFMYESINRFLAHPGAEIQARMDALFGTPDWRRIQDVADADDRRDRLVALYRSQLSEVARLKYVRTFEMLNEGNRTSYFLCFGTNSGKGLSKMKEAMWKADPHGGQAFSDRTALDDQLVLLLGAESGLRQALRARFSSAGWVSIEEVSRFVLEETPYSETMHLKRKTLGPMESEAKVQVQRPPGKRARIGEYPDGTKLKFP